MRLRFNAPFLDSFDIGHAFKKLEDGKVDPKAALAAMGVREQQQNIKGHALAPTPASTPRRCAA